MFRGFNLSLTEDEMVKLSEKTQPDIIGGRKPAPAYYSINDNVKNTLDSYIRPNGSIDATKMTNDWFPEINAHVFLSHSHQDEKLAISFASYLEKVFHIRCFIDSCVWGYSNDLLRKIDEVHCYNQANNTFIYENRNYSTSHVHMMLSTALAKMIDKCECLLFLNTPKSITVSDAKYGAETNSPWLYFELMTTQLIRRVPPKREKREIRKSLMEKTAERILDVAYPANLDHLTKLNYHDISQWREYYNRGIGEESLDLLYELKPEEHLRAQLLQ